MLKLSASIKTLYYSLVCSVLEFDYYFYYSHTSYSKYGLELIQYKFIKFATYVLHIEYPLIMMLQCSSLNGLCYNSLLRVWGWFTRIHHLYFHSMFIFNFCSIILFLIILFLLLLLENFSFRGGNNHLFPLSVCTKNENSKYPFATKR